MFKRAALFVGTLSAALLTGCAFVPEKVTLSPKVQYKHSQVGHGKAVALKVIDARPSTSLGGRASGYGPAASIKLSSDHLIQVVRSTVAKGLRANDFRVVSPGMPATAKLVVRINALEYRQRAGFWTGHIDLNSSVEADASEPHNQSYDKVYRYTGTKNVVFTPTSGSDHKQINHAVSNSLSQLLNDRKLMHFLAR